MLRKILATNLALALMTLAWEPPLALSAVCEVGTPTADMFYPMADKTPFFTLPNTAAPKVLNQRATEALGRKDYRDLWTGMVLQGECQTDQWIKGRIVEADGRSVDWEAGWVQKKVVRSNKSSDELAGLVWDPDNERDLSSIEKGIMRAGARQALAERRNCNSIVAGGKSGKKADTFFVTCQPPGNAPSFNIWFTAKTGAGGFPTLDMLPGNATN